MSPFLYTLLVILTMLTSLICLLYKTNWELIDARKKAADTEAARVNARSDALNWEAKCHKAWERNGRPPSWMQESGLDIQVGENRVPLYKPFGVFTFNRTERFENYLILKGNEIIETQPLPAAIDVCNGDSLYLYVEVKK